MCDLRHVRIWIVAGMLSVVAATAQAQLAQSPTDPLKPPAIAAESVPTVPPELMERLRQYQELRSAMFRGWSPDGKGILISTRFGDTAQLHRVYAPGGRREQITFLREPVSGRFIPKAKDGGLLLSMSQGGSENDQVLYLDRATGRATQLTDGKSRNISQAISKDGRQVVVGSNRRNGRDSDLFLYDPRKPNPVKTLLQETGEFWSALDWSFDGRLIALARYVSANESYPAVISVETGVREPLPLPGTAPMAFGSMKFSHDGQSLYVTCDAQGEFSQLGQLNLKTMKYTWLTSDIPWDVDELELHPKQEMLAFTINEDGAGALRLLENGKISSIELPLGIISDLEFSPDGEHLGFTLGRADAPADAYSLKLSDRSLTQWTFSEAGGLDVKQFVAPKRIRVAAADNLEIPAYYFQPKQASKDKPAPVLISIHGGPESQYRPGLSGTEQFYLNELGIAILQPNVRGSAGYGKTYLRLDNADKREDSVKDIGALLDWIARQPDLDSRRVAVIGGSYGGYMVLASLVHYGDRLKAGIDIVGIASFNSFLKNTSPYRQDLRRAEYGDERDPKMQAYFQQIDPLNHADKIRSAMLVVHGKNDPRVPFSEAEQIAAKVRANGREVWTVYADNEGHGFAKKVNRDYQSAVITLFLMKHLAE